MSWRYEQLESRLKILISELDLLSGSEAGEIEQFLNAGEYGVAFETLCAIIREESKVIPDRCKAEVESLAEQMNIDRSWWESLVQGSNP